MGWQGKMMVVCNLLLDSFGSGVIFEVAKSFLLKVKYCIWKVKDGRQPIDLMG